MKKIILFCFIGMLFVGCTHYDSKTGIAFQIPNANVLPEGFEKVREAGNGWYLYSSPVGFFLVSVQGRSTQSPFVEMVPLGRDLAE